MDRSTVQLVTIVAEAVLADVLVALVKSAGANGYTIADVRGEGSRGRRVGEIPGENVRLEVVTGADVADRILAQLAERYFPNYAIAAWVSDVRVLRGGKYA